MQDAHTSPALVGGLLSEVYVAARLQRDQPKKWTFELNIINSSPPLRLCMVKEVAEVGSTLPQQSAERQVDKKPGSCQFLDKKDKQRALN